MNKVILCGRLTRDPEVRYSQGAEPMAIARYTLAVDRRRGRSNDPNEQSADFISIVAFGKAGEFAEKYLKKGTKMLITGRIQTGSYTNKRWLWKIRSLQSLRTTHQTAETLTTVQTAHLHLQVHHQMIPLPLQQAMAS